MKKAATKSKVDPAGTPGDLLALKLQELSDVEARLMKAIPGIIKKAGDEDLRKKLATYAEQADEHAEAIEQAFMALDVKAPKFQGQAIRGLVADFDWVAKNVKGQEAQDAACVALIRSVMHYKIAGYGAALEWAKRLHEDKVAGFLEGALEEEADAEESLGDLAESKLDPAVFGESSENEGGGTNNATELDDEDEDEGEDDGDEGDDEDEV